MPDAHLRSELWTSRVWPGAVLVGGEIVGTWRRAEAMVTLQSWRPLSRPNARRSKRKRRTCRCPASRADRRPLGQLRRELAPGLWQWETSHPDWEASEPWDQDGVVVRRSTAMGGCLLFDPLGLPAELDALAGEREAAIVLTSPWHERDAQSLVERLGLPVYAPPPDTAQDLIDRFGVTAERAGDGSPDLRLAPGGRQRHLLPVRRRPAVRDRRVPRA